MISLEFYLNDKRDDNFIEYALSEHPPQLGGTVQLRRKDGYEKFRVIETEYWYDCKSSTNNIPSCAVFLERIENDS